jgi:hypothetical protein
MKRLNTYQFYELGVALHQFSQVKSSGCTIGDLLWPALTAMAELSKYTGEGGVFSQSSKRAATIFLATLINAGVPSDYRDLPKLDTKLEVKSYQVDAIKRTLADLETVMSNDLPGVPTYFVVPKGIYSTDDLITHAVNHIPEQVRTELPAKAKLDICEAGKCLAFEVATGSAFHMWRAVESVMNRYHEALTGKTFEAAKVKRNWANYIEALEKAGAEEKITVFLNHIRVEYRNPISHPDDTLELDEAFNLFGAALSVVGMTLKAIRQLKVEAALLPSVAPKSLAAAMAAEGSTQTEKADEESVP